SATGSEGTGPACTDGPGPAAGERPRSTAHAELRGAALRGDCLHPGNHRGDGPQTSRPRPAATAHAAVRRGPFGVRVMNDAVVSSNASLEARVAEVVDEFMSRCRQGEQPDVEEYASRSPD